MAKMLLLNPRRRRKTSAKKTVHHAHHAYHAHRASTKRRTHRHNPIHAHRRHARHHVRRYRRNPIATGGLMHILTNSALGAGGAVATDLIFGFLPLPLTSNMAKQSAKAALAIGLGFAAGKMLGKERGAKIAEGALTVIMANAVQNVMKPASRAVAGLSLPDQSGLPQLAAYAQTDDLLAGLGAYQYDVASV